MILWLVLVLVSAWYITFRYRRRNMYRLANKISGPDDEMPGCGIAIKLTGDTEDIMNTLQRYSRVAMTKDGMMRGWLGHILYFIAVDPIDIEMVLKSCMEKDNLHRFLRRLIGNASIFAPVSIWRRRRKIMVPAFTAKIVETFVEVFSEQSEKLAKKLSSYADIGQFSMWPFLSTYTLDSVCETAMGVKINAQDNPASPFLIAMNSLLNIVTERIFHLWLQPDWLFKLFPQYPRHEQYIRHMHDFTDEVIKKKREEINSQKQNEVETKEEFDLINYKRKTFLDMLIHLSGGEKGYSDVELREETLMLAVAGTDTSAVSIGFTLKLLAMYPAVQERVYQEIYDIFGESDRPLEKADLINLKYLDRVVKESLRLYPPVPFVIRKVLEDTTLPSGKVLPAGSGVVVSIWGVHRNPKYWGADADKFDPDRFSPERLNLKYSCTFMPFSNGPRNCLGYQYALMSVKTAISAILRRYKLKADVETSDTPEIRVKLDVMMKAVDNYKLALERRKPEKTSNNPHL